MVRTDPVQAEEAWKQQYDSSIELIETLVYLTNPWFIYLKNEG